MLTEQGSTQPDPNKQGDDRSQAKDLSSYRQELSGSARLELYCDVFLAGIQANDASLVTRATDALIEESVADSPATRSAITTLSDALISEQISKERFGSQREDVAISTLISMSQLCSWTNSPEQALPAMRHIIHDSPTLSSSEEVVHTALRCVADLYESCPNAQLTEVLMKSEDHPLSNFAELNRVVLTQYLSPQAFNRDLMLHLVKQAMNGEEGWVQPVIQRFEEPGMRVAEIKDDLMKMLASSSDMGSGGRLRQESKLLLRLIGAIGPDASNLIEPIIENFRWTDSGNDLPVRHCLGRLGGSPAIIRFESSQES